MLASKMKYLTTFCILCDFLVLVALENGITESTNGK